MNVKNLKMLNNNSNANKSSIILYRIEDIPLMAINVKILKFWSLLLNDNWRQYAAIVPYLVLNALQLLGLHNSNGLSPPDIIRDVYLTILISNTCLRAFLMTLNRERFRALLEYLASLYMELMELPDCTIRQMLQECSQLAEKLSKLNLAMGILTCMGFFTLPFMTKERALVFNIHVPVVDKYESPWYELVFAIQVIMTPAGMCMFIPFSSLLVSMILFASLMCRVLQRKLRSITGTGDKKVREEIIQCIKYQLKVVSLVDTIYSINTLMFLIEFLLFGALLCALLFSIIIIKTVMQKIIIAVFLAMIFGQSFVTYYYANELYYQSLEVATAVYDINWYEYDVEMQKLLALMMARTQKPCAILIGNVYPMNMGRLLALLKVTYSVYTLLQRLYG